MSYTWPLNPFSRCEIPVMILTNSILQESLTAFGILTTPFQVISLTYSEAAWPLHGEVIKDWSVINKCKIILLSNPLDSF